MNTINYLAFAIPGFFIFLYLEYAFAIKKKRGHLFKYESFVSNVSIGIAERLLNLFIAGSFFSLFQFIHENYAVFNIPSAWWIWIVLLLATDLVWYWYHRLGHEINLLWAAHIVHHQSEEFNLSVAARITTFQALIRYLFWCVLPFIGFNPLMVAIILTVHGTYSFFTHTQMIRRIRWLEYILITPSLHGIHHASDEKYLDKNYGDVFVFWDKIFGTFQSEEEQPKYGLTHPIGSYSFLWQHFHYYFELAEACRRQTGIKAKLKVIFGSPELLDQGIRPYLERRFFQYRKGRDKRFRFRNYLNFQLLGVVLLLTFTTAFFIKLGYLDRLYIVSMVLITLVNCGALLEQRRWIYYLEYARLLLTSWYALIKFDHMELVFLPLLLVVVLEQVFALSKLYIRYVLRYDLAEARPKMERKF
jgi:alkylglycerol monooxygenase